MEPLGGEAIVSHPRFQKVRELGSGNFGVARLERDIMTGELSAIKYIPRGSSVDENVAREIICHRMMRHRNIVLFKEVLVTPTHLAIVMEYAAGGELFERICAKGPFPEEEARYFFRQLIAGVAYCHSQSVAHRDLKLENALLDGSDPDSPALKICDFGYSKSSVLHSAAKTTVGTPAYIAPEVLQRTSGYDGPCADVWSCGVTLYVMLVGVYPFEDPQDPKNFRKTMHRILTRTYTFPPSRPVSADVQDLLSRIFVVDPRHRLGVAGIAAHFWFRGDGPTTDLAQLAEGLPEPAGGMQSVEEVLAVVREAQRAPAGAPGAGRPGAVGGADVEGVGSDVLLDRGASGVGEDEYDDGDGSFGA